MKNKNFKTIYERGKFKVSKNHSGIIVRKEEKYKKFIPYGKYPKYPKFPNWNNFLDVCFLELETGIIVN